MPSLILLDGGDPDTPPFELSDADAVIGRLPDNAIWVNQQMVSRRHAKVVPDGDGYAIEDLGSGNGTFVNGKRIEGRTVLVNADRVRLGPVLFRYEDPDQKSPDPFGETLTNSGLDTDATGFETDISVDIAEGERDQATIMASLGTASGFGRIDIRPEQKLKAVVTLSRAIAGQSDIKVLLPSVLDSLFEIFPAADRGCILVREPGRGLVPAAQKLRQAGSDDSVRLSKTVINKIVESKQGQLWADAASDDSFSASESIASLSIRSVMCVPMLDADDDDVIGVIQLDSLNPRVRFREEDLDLLQAVAGQAALAYETARYHLSHMLKVKQDNELGIATTVQRTLLPETLPQVDGYSFAAAYHAAQAVGGDYYDCFTLPTGHVVISFGDVAGKGVPGALIMSRLASCVQNVLRYEQDCAKAFADINAHMCAKMAEGRFVTYVLAVLDPPSGRVTFANGGHMPLLLRHADGRVDSIGEDKIGLPIGIVDGFEYETTTFTLGPGETVLIVTDGVDEAMNPAGELYTKERVDEFLEVHNENAASLVEDLLTDVRRHADGREQNDDITLLAFGRSQ
ncbi:MAG: SpoIIE family protein phosphatase [Planctomycetota bacterium]